MITGYPTMAKFAVYDFKTLEMREYWHDTYRQAINHAKSFNAYDKVIVGTIFVVEVQP